MPWVPPVNFGVLEISRRTTSPNPMVVRDRYTPLTLRLGYPSPLPIRIPMITAAISPSQGVRFVYLVNRAEE